MSEPRKSDNTATFGDPSPEGVDLAAVVSIFWTWRWLIVIMTCVGLAVGVAIFKFSVRYFQAETKFLAKVESGASSNFSDLMALAGVKSRSTSAIDPSSYIEEIVFGDELLEAIVTRRWDFRGDSAYLSEIWRMKPDTSYAAKRSQMERLRLKGFIGIEKIKTNGIIVLSTLFESPQLAIDVNKYITQYINEYMVNKLLTSARQNRIFIEERVKETRSSLEKSEHALSDFRMHNLNTTSPSLLLQLGRLTRNMKVNEEIYLELMKQLELAKIEEQKHHPVIEIINRPAMAVTYSKPKRNLVLGLSTILGAILALLIASTLEGVRSASRKKSSKIG